MASTVSRPSLLQRVGADLVADADAPTLVAPEVDERAEAFLGDAGHGRVELDAAVAAQEPKTSPVRHSEWTRTRTFSSPCTAPRTMATCCSPSSSGLVGVAGEVAPLGGDAGLGDAADQLLVLAPVADEVGDGDHQQAVLLGERDQIGDPGHGAVLVDDLAEDPRRVEAGHAGQVDGGLGVPGPLQHAAVAVAQREDVARAGEVGRAGGRVDEGLDGGGAVGRRDARAWCRGGSRRCR